MKSMHLLLDDAEKAWREDVRTSFPLYADFPVIRTASKNGRDWSFSTDLRRIFAEISGDESLQEKFKTIIARYWDGNPEELARDTLHYLLHHELYHPIEAPFSVKGEENDNKCIHQAIRRGILEAEPSLGPLEQIVKVQASQNGVKDFILDNRFAIDNREGSYVRDDIIPTWDLLELQDTPSRANFYTITRLLYGLLYGPQSTHGFFAEKSGKEGPAVAEKALAALVGKPAQLPKKKRLPAKAKWHDGSSDVRERLREYITAIRTVFSGEDRYAGIQRFMAVLGPYVEESMPQGRPDMQGEGSGSSPQDILQDLLDDMNPEEQAQFVQGLQENPGAKKPGSAKPRTSDSTVDEMRNLDVLAAHEFYKRNHPAVAILEGRKVGENVIVGSQEYWDLKKSTILTRDEVAGINIKRIDALQRISRLPWLIDLGNGTYRLNEYEVRRRNIKTIVYADATVDVPGIVEFYVDSSGSMFSKPYQVNDGSRWDMLCHSLYGYIDALQQAGKRVGKQAKIRIHNFADSQIDSQLITVDRFWRGDTDALRVLFKPENGENTYPCIDDSVLPGRAAYVIITDGNVKHCDREAEKMRRLARNNDVVLFEIGATYALGRAVKNDARIAYLQVHDREKMLQAGLHVLLSKREVAVKSPEAILS